MEGCYLLEKRTLGRSDFINEGGMVVLVGTEIRSSVSGQVEFGMPVCHPKFHNGLEFPRLEI